MTSCFRFSYLRQAVLWLIALVFTIRTISAHHPHHWCLASAPLVSGNNAMIGNEKKTS